MLQIDAIFNQTVAVAFLMVSVCKFMKEATLESQKSLSFDINFGEQLGEGEVKCEEGGETHRGKMWLGWMLFRLKSVFTFISNYCG